MEYGTDDKPSEFQIYGLMHHRGLVKPTRTSRVVAGPDQEAVGRVSSPLGGLQQVYYRKGQLSSPRKDTASCTISL